MAKCDQTQLNLHALAASKTLNLVIAAFFAPSEHGGESLMSPLLIRYCKRIYASVEITEDILVILLMGTS